MFIAWVIFHVLVCVALILVVLMQSSKGEGLAGSAFGGGGGAVSGAVFGGRGAATFLGKATTVLAIVFMLNCGALAFMSANRQPGVSPEGITDSAVTRQAQREAEERMQRQEQQQQMAQPADTAGGLNLMQEKTTESEQPAGEESSGN